MRLFVDTKNVTFTVTKNPEPKMDQNKQQRHRKSDGAPMWTTQVMALDEEGGEVINITVAGQMPSATVGQMVIPVNFEAIYWTAKERSGIAYRADELQPVTAGSGV